MLRAAHEGNDPLTAGHLKVDSASSAVLASCLSWRLNQGRTTRAYPDASKSALLDGIPDLGPGRVFKSSHAQEHHAALDARIVVRLHQPGVLWVAGAVIAGQRAQGCLHRRKSEEREAKLTCLAGFDIILSREAVWFV